MAENRYYGSGTEKALFMLSRGTCYEPTCNVRVLKMTSSGRPQVNVQIAHIHALADGEARFDSNLPKKERNRFKNLILLCQAHHTEVDSAIWVTDYPADVLFGWKAAVEHGDLKAALDDVPPLDSDAQLQEVLGNAVEIARVEILGAIEELKGVGEDTVKMVKTLLTEAFNRPYLSDEQIDSLEESARILVSLEGQTLMLHDSAQTIRSVEEYGMLLANSVEPIKMVPDYLPALVSFADAIRMLPDYTRPFSDATQILGDSRTSINHLHDAVYLISNMNLVGDMASQVDQLSHQVRQVESVVNRFGGAAGGLERINDTADAMAATAESLTLVDNAPVAVRLHQLEKGNMFWAGFSAAIGVVLAIGILIAVLF